MSNLIDAVEYELNIFRSNRDYWREGQRAFNALLLVNVDLANRIRGTEIDPFYDDAKLPEFWKFLAAEAT